MIAYGMAKAATHYLVASAAATGGLQDGRTAIGVTPRTIDTPGNRAAMPDAADRATWTPTDVIATKILALITQAEVPVPGALYEPETSAGGSTVWQVHEQLHRP